MSRPGSSRELRVAIVVLRALRGWSQEELAAASGVNRVQISNYEAGKQRPTPKTLARLVAASGVSPAAFQALLAVLGQILAGKEIQASAADGSAGPVLQAVAAAQESARVRVLAATARRAGPRSPEALRREAADAWERLKVFSGQDRRVLVDGAPEYQTWALCELLCEESLRAAAADPRQAIELADLAVRVASRVAGEKSWRSQLQGYALAHLGNARRRADDFERAEADFQRAWDFWEAGTDPNGLLDRGLIFYLQASLRKDQRRFSEAQALNEQAVAHVGLSRLGDVFLHQAFTLELMGDYSRAIEALEKAKQHIDARRSPRSAFGIRFNLAVNLAHLNRYAEAAELLPEVREMAVELGNELDLLRVRWLEARIAAGQGRKTEAAEALFQVREGFLSRDLGYDAALASLELAVLYLEEERTGEVKALAREMAPIFQAQGVHREALAALRLFCEAAERETVTLEMARRLVHYLERARRDPVLRFAG